MNSAELADFRRMIRELRELCPTLVPVKVRRRPLSNDDGVSAALWDEKERLYGFRITIDSRLPYTAAWRVLLHEWAHCLAWDDGHETLSDHDPMTFGVKYAYVYQEIVAP